MSNRLASESSPYLLQHAENPVDWYPWGEEALGRARAEDKPIFLSIGYSACHWCHVMEHESFENEAIAKELNEQFVCIKVDREERPDLDQIYMHAVQIMTGHGGWPMSVFLTPDLQPFYGGTYWPPERKMNMPGFPDVLRAVMDAWVNRREAAIRQAGDLTQRIQQLSKDTTADDAPDATSLDEAFQAFQRIYDFHWGGFGRAPKFPHAMDLQVLLRYWRRSGDDKALNMVQLNLDMMARGGIYDHLAGGFARYSVDQKWLVPHFEKMLYDNALLAEAYIDAYLATGNLEYQQIARATLDYLLTDMQDAAGGFHSTEDADSEGEEGKYYVWSPSEVVSILGEERGQAFCEAYDITDLGNFEGRSIPNRLPRNPSNPSDIAFQPSEFDEDRARLLEAREKRVRPGKDDKILASWNGLMIHALARASMGLREPRYRDAAERAADFIWSEMRTGRGRLLHSWRHGKAKFDAYLEDYAFLTNAFVTVYEATFDERHIERACELADQMLERFDDADGGGFFFTASDHESLIARSKDLHDSSIPSSNAMAATALLRLSRLTGDDRYDEAASAAILAGGGLLRRAPQASGQMLIALDMALGPFREVVIVGRDDQPQTARIRDAAYAQFSPNQVIALRSPEGGEPESSRLDSAFVGRLEHDEPTMFLCERFTCRAPLTGESAVDALRAD